jgi:hypothetical protein
VEDFSFTQVRSEAGLSLFSTTITVIIVPTSIWLRLSYRSLLWAIFTAETIKNSALTLMLTGTIFMIMTTADRRSPPATGILVLLKAPSGLQFHKIVFSRFSRSIGSSLAPALKIGPMA